MVEPIILKLNVNCRGCAKKVRKAIEHMDGVGEVRVYDNGTVTVTGNPVAADLKRRLEHKMKTKVIIVSAGNALEATPWGDAPPPAPRAAEASSPQTAPPQATPPQAPPPTQQYGGGLQDPCSHYYSEQGGSAWGPQPTHQQPPVPTDEWANPQYQSAPNDMGHYLSEDNANGCSIM